MSQHTTSSTTRVTVPSIRALKGTRPISMLTAYDYPTATLLDEAGIDVLLVGDSLGSVVYGEPNTLSVTVKDMIRHGRAVARGASRALVVIDLPFLSYQVSIPNAIRNAGKILKETGAHAVKLEGGVEYAKTVRALVNAGIPVVAHIGLTPQFMNIQGAFRTHGKTLEEEKALLQSAVALQEAGSFCLVLECVKASVADQITRTLQIPTIGIGSGPSCDGQVLVFHDLVGLTSGHVPKFVKQELQARRLFTEAVKRYVASIGVPGEDSGQGAISGPTQQTTKRTPQKAGQ